MKTFFALLMLLLSRPAGTQLLYPGDANNDATCNYLDLIPIGVAYGATGPPRPLPGFSWAPVEYNTWEMFLPQSGLDFAFADADGLDTINANDIRVIAFNYDSVQFSPPSFPPPQPYLPLLDTLVTGFPAPHIAVFFSQDTVDVLDTFYAEIQFIGQPNTLFNGAMAVALRLQFDPANFGEHPPRLLFDTLAPDLMSVGATFHAAGFDRSPPEGVAELAVSGRGQNAFLFPRKVAALEYILDMIIRNPAPEVVVKPFWIEFDEVVLVNDQEMRLLPVTTFSDTIILRQLASGVLSPGSDANVRLLPNPARDRVTVQTSPALRLETVRLWDGLGRLVLNLPEPGQQPELSLSGLPPGVFWVEISTDRGPVWRKLVVVH